MTFPPRVLARTLSVALLVSAILPHASISAQTPPMGPPTGPAVWMDPFVVTSNTDSGYIAVDSLAGGRANTLVKLTPSSISSLTRTFFDDAGLQNARAALKWAPNVVPCDWTAGKRTPFNNWDYNFRGAG